MKRKKVYQPPEAMELRLSGHCSLLTALSISAEVGDFGVDDSSVGDFSGVGGFDGDSSRGGNFGHGIW